VTVYVDEEFHVKKSDAALGGLKLEQISCSREFALSKSEQVDLGTIAIIQCPVRLNSPGKAKSIKYHLVPVDNIELDIPACDNQSVQQGEDGSLFVTVHPVKASAGCSFPYQGDNRNALEALKPTELLQCDDEKIIALAWQAVGDTKDAAAAAEKIEKFVHGYIRPAYSSVFASAVEVADERKGDCTEYAVLTAALCRAAGIPARVVVGYVYVDYYNFKWNIFVPHAWVEVYIADKWVGLDATRTRFFGMFNTFTAGHIALSGIDNKPDLSGIGSLKTFKIQHVEQ
jgi:hypothetical protein